eukprot:CAMPEP_0198137328 /NCGR_PEP_ID=MMETSP1443-20131203/847_1 /TAXON_ID=186043 /ORGANISM="Entomoneis sp., Strain CCMP2396" /LENGTH=224 /DNA_ID=CAMNT_0043798727 /DNA_START=98 /DNA_END=772 /DNA_ORIENTATION=-
MILRSLVFVLSFADMASALSLGNGQTSKNNGVKQQQQPQHQAPSRREALAFVVAGASTAAFGSSALLPPSFNNVAWAAGGTPPTSAELERLKVGYNQIAYLLANFDAETTICRENGGECKRDSEAIRRALGLRYTTDPLFQIEKVLAKIRFMDIDPEELEPLFESIEEWESAVSMSNSMAFIAKFGEYNPGGGQDQVLKFLLESKTQLIAAEKALGTIMKVLNL